MDYLVIGEIPGQSLLMEYFNTFEEAVDFIYRHDALGRCRIRCPGNRWFHPHTYTWR